MRCNSSEKKQSLAYLSINGFSLPLPRIHSSSRSCPYLPFPILWIRTWSSGSGCHDPTAQFNLRDDLDSLFPSGALWQTPHTYDQRPFLVYLSKSISGASTLDQFRGDQRHADFKNGIWIAASAKLFRSGRNRFSSGVMRYWELPSSVFLLGLSSCRYCISSSSSVFSYGG